MDHDSRRPATATATGNKSSNIPRPSASSSSRLPIPQPRPSLAATSPSSQSTTLSSRRLRSTPSRDQLASNDTPATFGTTAARGTATRKRVPPPVSSQGALQDLQPSDRSRSVARDSSRNSRGSSISRTQVQTKDTTIADRSSFKRPSLPGLRSGRRPSGQFALSTENLIEQDNGGVGGDDSDDNYDEDQRPFRENFGSIIPGSSSGMKKPTPLRTSRPSLSERTIETLSALPSSPAFKRQGSNFDTGAPGRPQSRPRSQSRPGSRDLRPESRPGSSYRSDGPTETIRSRPGSSSGQDNTNFRASTHAPKVPPLPTLEATPTRRVSASTPTLTMPRSSLVKMPSRSSLSASVGPGSRHISQLEIKNGSKSLAARPLKSRVSVNGLFKQSTEGPASPECPIRSRSPRKNSLASANSSGEDRNPSSASTASTTITIDSAEDGSASTSRKSSSALREQIAKAKAAKRATSRQPPRAVVAATMVSGALETPVVPTDPTFDFGLSDNPFGQKKFEDSNRRVMQSRTETARTTGRLNISAMGLKGIPDVVLKMYDLESIGGNDGAWAESVDLTRFVAADNEIESIEDAIFPDIDPSDLVDDDDGGGHQFAGLESLDLHNNSLIALPVGLRQLHFLTSLNLVCPFPSTGSLSGTV